MRACVVEARGVTKHFGPIAAVTDLTLDVPAGASFAVVGPNGAGKTTLFSLIAGFLRPSRGAVTVFGFSAGSARLAGRISILPQDARLLPHVPIAVQLRFHARLLGYTTPEAVGEANRVLELVGLSDVGGREPRMLSHGMTKRVALAQALLGSPSLLLLDEPTAGLDPAAARTVRDVLRGLRGRATVLVASHNLAELEDVCSEIAILDAGKLIEQAPLGEFLQRDACLSVTLDDAAVLETQALSALPGVRHVDVRARLGEHRVTVYLETDADVGEMQMMLLQWFADRHVVPRAMHRGRSLEERVLEVTSPRAG